MTDQKKPSSNGGTARLLKYGRDGIREQARNAEAILAKGDIK